MNFTFSSGYNQWKASYALNEKKTQHQKWKANFANENRDDLTKSFEHFLS